MARRQNRLSTPCGTYVEMVDGMKNQEDRLAAEGYQNADLRAGSADTSGCVNLRSLHLQIIAPLTFQRWSIWNLEINVASLRVDSFGCEVFLRASAEWDPAGTHRVWMLHSPAYGSHDAPAAFRC